MIKINDIVEICGVKYKVVPAYAKYNWCIGCECENCNEAFGIANECRIGFREIIFKKVSK